MAISLMYIVQRLEAVCYQFDIMHSGQENCHPCSQAIWHINKHQIHLMHDIQIGRL